MNLGRCELSAATADHSSLESLQAVLFQDGTLTLSSRELHKEDGATSATRDAVTRKVDTAGEQMAREDPVAVLPLPAVRQERNTGLK